jgi:hypothetical protein
VRNLSDKLLPKSKHIHHWHAYSFGCTSVRWRFKCPNESKQFNKAIIYVFTKINLAAHEMHCFLNYSVKKSSDTEMLQMKPKSKAKSG